MHHFRCTLSGSSSLMCILGRKRSNFLGMREQYYDWHGVGVGNQANTARQDTVFSSTQRVSELQTGWSLFDSLPTRPQCFSTQGVWKANQKAQLCSCCLVSFHSCLPWPPEDKFTESRNINIIVLLWTKKKTENIHSHKTFLNVCSQWTPKWLLPHFRRNTLDF